MKYYAANRNQEEQTARAAQTILQSRQLVSQKERG